MKLYYTPTSPFVRKVLIAAHEVGLADRIETTLLRPSPMTPSPELSQQNPLSKIPALILDDGHALYDSPVICEYLSSIGARPLFPERGDARWRALRLQALSDGVLDAGILSFYERTQRPEALQWAAWLDGQTAKVNQGLDALEREAASFGDEVSIATISAAAAVGWLAFRAPAGDPLSGRPQLARWFGEFSLRPSMVATAPKA